MVSPETIYSPAIPNSTGCIYIFMHLYARMLNRKGGYQLERELRACEGLKAINDRGMMN